MGHTRPLPALRKLGFSMAGYDSNSELPNSFSCKPPMSNFSTICETVYGVHKKVQVQL